MGVCRNQFLEFPLRKEPSVVRSNMKVGLE